MHAIFRRLPPAKLLIVTVITGLLFGLTPQASLHAQTGMPVVATPVVRAAPSATEFDNPFALVRFLLKLWKEHSYLRSGSWQTFISDDTGLYVVGRKDNSGAGIIAVNPSSVSRTVDLELAGYLPWGATLIDPASGQTNSVSLHATIPPMGFRIWHTQAGIDLTPPPAPVIDSVVKGSTAITLTITIPPQTSRVIVRRSAGDADFASIGMIESPDRGKTVTFVDEGLSSSQTYRYQITAANDVGLLSAPSEVVQAGQ